MTCAAQDRSKLFRNFRVMTMREDGNRYGLLSSADILVEDGIIKAISNQSASNFTPGTSIVEGNGRLLSPGLIDCHTHLVYAGNRAEEWEQRLSGVPYEEIARRGGGILSTVRATRAASEAELVEIARKRVAELIKQGVTTAEIKSGYGLDLETELKMLRAARRLAEELPITVPTTLLAAHAVPPEFAGRSDEYITQVCEEIIPAAKDYCVAVDVFCESIAFNIEQTRRVFEASQRLGLAIKVHAEQLSYTGSAALAAKMGALSADHLEYLAEPDCKLMAKHGTVATLLPGAFYHLKEKQLPPVDALRKAGARIAIATDSNPGSSPVGSILLMAHMACTFFGLTPEEAFAGLTRNAAIALGLGDSIGTLEAGKRADLVVWDAQSPAELVNGIGHNPCSAVYRGGQLVYDAEA